MIYPRAFAIASAAGAARDAYLSDPAAMKLVEFFVAKGLAALKDEDRREQWYDDWLTYQAEHGLYAAVISPKKFSSRGAEFDLLRYARFLEIFAYFSPAHGYSLQCSFLGLFSILMGSSDALKREAVAALEAGELLAFGISERDHGSDLFGNEFTVAETTPGEFVANGSKYYIGNASSAAIIAILSRKTDGVAAVRSKRAPFVLFALRPKHSASVRNMRKIRTLGVRAAYVGEFEVKDHALGARDIIAGGRQAWDAFFGTVTLGKFFLGFGSIGMCEHAWEDSIAHLSGRMLYGKAAIELPHLRRAMAQAYARLTAMKLYAYRALDYIHAATAEDRRHLLFCAVQKAKVSTEGVKVMATLSECINAKGFEADTYFEMALRDIQLVPGLEGSTHINLNMAAQFIDRYFSRKRSRTGVPDSLVAGTAARGENEFLLEARSGAINTIEFPNYLNAYRPIKSIANVRMFARQVMALRRFIRAISEESKGVEDATVTQAIGQCLATVVYGQLVAENVQILRVPAEMISVIFELLIKDLDACALNLVSLPEIGAMRGAIDRLVATPRTTREAWEFVANHSREAK